MSKKVRNIISISGTNSSFEVVKNKFNDQKLSDQYDQLNFNMLFVKVGTLMSHMAPNEVKKFYECDYEFDVDPDTMKPYKLHCWVGKNHKLRDQIHTEYDVPIHFQLPLVA